MRKQTANDMRGLPAGTGKGRALYLASGLLSGILLMPAMAYAETAKPACPPAEASSAVSRGLGGLASLGGRLAARLGANGIAKDAAEAAAEGAGRALAAPGDCTPVAEPAPAAAAAGAATSTPRFKLPTLSAAGSGGRNCGALGAGCADGLTPVVNCKKEKGYWSETALALERKRDSHSYSELQRSEIEQDIAAMRAAHDAGSSHVTPVDPARPNRHQDWFSSEEQGQLNTAIARTINSHRQECDRRYAKF